MLRLQCFPHAAELLFGNFSRCEPLAEGCERAVTATPRFDCEPHREQYEEGSHQKAQGGHTDIKYVHGVPSFPENIQAALVLFLGDIALGEGAPKELDGIGFRVRAITRR
jgi:hypothetical protein